jgi:nitric oxide reductase activation protein
VPGRDWTRSIALPDSPESRTQPGGVIEDRLDLCERAYAVGNEAALQVAVNVCAQRNIPHPVWLNAAHRAMTEEAIDPKKKHASGSHARVLNRVNDMRLHLYRMQFVLQELVAADMKDEHISMNAAYNQAAKRLADQLKGDDPARTVKDSYKRATEIVSRERERDFIGPWVSPYLMLRSLEAIEHFSHTSTRKK